MWLKSNRKEDILSIPSSCRAPATAHAVAGAALLQEPVVITHFRLEHFLAMLTELYLQGKESGGMDFITP
jgi:hypothetical protein